MLRRDRGQNRVHRRAGRRTAPTELTLATRSLSGGYLDGAEYSVETFNDHVMGVTAKRLGPEPHFVETGHDFPAPLSTGDRAAIGDAVDTALRALGLGWGAAHVEVRFTSSGPRIVEINPRLAGGMIPRMVQEATGVDLVSCVVARAAGLQTVWRVWRDRAASIRFLVAHHSGLLTAIHGAEEAATLPGVVEVGVLARVGYHIELRRSFQDRLAYVIAVADDGGSAATAAEAGVQILEAEIVSSPGELGGFNGQ